MRCRGQIAAALGLLLALSPLGAVHGAKKKQAPVSDETINAAVDRGVTYIKNKQRDNGSWDGDRYGDGVTALAVYALIKAKCPLDDAAVVRGVKAMLNTPVPTDPKRAHIYSLSMAALALSAVIEKGKGKRDTSVDVAACLARLRETADLLVTAQHKCRGRVGIIRGPKAPRIADIQAVPNTGGDGYNLDPFRKIDGGAWGYNVADTRYVDNSNTQFALLALRAAQNIADSLPGAKISIPREMWVKALARLVSVQTAAGEWDYGTINMGTKGFRDTMTAAGISGLVICLSSLIPGPDIREISQTPEIRKAVRKLERHVYPPANVVRFHSTGLKQPNRTGYMFYSLERACLLGGFKKLGTHDWYSDGAAELLAAQHQDGSWSGAAWYSARASRHKAPKYRDNTIETAFCLLFLRRAVVYTPAHKPYSP